jgi:hypothetical protein
MIKARLAASETAVSLAAEHAVSKWSIYAIKQGRYFSPATLPG